MHLSTTSDTWICGDQNVDLTTTTQVMGVLNVTPDSFSDGGCYFSPENAVEQSLRMEDAGASILDIGGESTRPGANAVLVEEELSRIIPVIECLAGRTSALLSVDTRKATVAGAATDVGAVIINDVSACTYDPDMAECARRAGAGVVLMHMRGKPETMQNDPYYRDVVGEVTSYLAERLRFCVARGLDEERLVIDPGIGFGKTTDHNLMLLQGLPTMNSLGRPLVVGLSRKQFLGELVGRPVEDRLAAGLGAHCFAVLQGAKILRVHDVKETCDAVHIVDILRNRV